MSNFVNAISEAVKAGLNADWITMGTSIADALAKGADFILGFLNS